MGYNIAHDIDDLHLVELSGIYIAKQFHLILVVVI